MVCGTDSGDVVKLLLVLPPGGGDGEVDLAVVACATRKPQAGAVKPRGVDPGHKVMAGKFQGGEYTSEKKQRWKMKVALVATIITAAAAATATTTATGTKMTLKHTIATSAAALATARGALEAFSIKQSG